MSGVTKKEQVNPVKFCKLGDWKVFLKPPVPHRAHELVPTREERGLGESEGVTV